MIRLLGTPPTPYNLTLLRQQAFAQFNDLVDCNEVSGQIAFYFPDVSTQGTQANVNSLLAAHVGTQKTQGQINEEAIQAAIANLKAVDWSTVPEPHRTIFRNILRIIRIIIS